MSSLLVCLLDCVCQASWFACWIVYVKPLGLLVGLCMSSLLVCWTVSDLLICLLDYVCQASWFACWIVYVKPLGLLDCVRPLGFLVALCM